MGSVIIGLLFAIVFGWIYSVRKTQRAKRKKMSFTGSQIGTMQDSRFPPVDNEILQEHSANGKPAHYVYTEQNDAGNMVRKDVSRPGVAPRKGKTEKSKERQSQEKSLIEELNLSDAENARKAFIASELLKRKY
ncbi:MAG TPA: hypothetical protein DIW30_08665 [Bacteroidales bacterium]|nr:hypothetical protein [Bacteroidales bacterium]